MTKPDKIMQSEISGKLEIDSPKNAAEALGAPLNDDKNLHQGAHSNSDIPIKVKEVGGPKGLEPTRYGDWESKGRCYDF